MKGYFEGYNDGIEDTKRNILEVIEKHQIDEPRDMLAAIIMFCKEKKANEKKANKNKAAEQ